MNCVDPSFRWVSGDISGVLRNNPNGLNVTSIDLTQRVMRLWLFGYIWYKMIAFLMIVREIKCLRRILTFVGKWCKFVGFLWPVKIYLGRVFRKICLIKKSALPLYFFRKKVLVLAPLYSFQNYFMYLLYDLTPMNTSFKSLLPRYCCK